MPRVLILNHFFDQDIDQLRLAGEPDFEVRVVGYEGLRADALLSFPPGIADTLAAAARPELERERRRFAVKAREWLHDEYSRRPFDALVLPGDQFFYVRPLPAACHELGLPCVAVQKETTLSPNTMIEWARDIRENAPPLIDWMTVCSERQVEFWTLAGASPDRLEVTGQPRFDLYTHESAAQRARRDPPVVLFFSYDMDAYHPQFGEGLRPWKALHEATEHALWELAREGWDVQIKPHPQQRFAKERARLERAVGTALQDRVELVRADADARRLILGADVVVGFQTTALIESLVPDKPVVYTGWDAEALSIGDELIPFHEWRDVIDVADRPEDLAPMIRAARGRRRDEASRRRAQEIVHTEIGPVDGRASARALARIRTIVADSERRLTPDARTLREQLAGRRAPSRPLRRAARRARVAVEVAREHLSQRH